MQCNLHGYQKKTEEKYICLRTQFFSENALQNKNMFVLLQQVIR